MHKYALGLLALLAVSCSAKKTETAADHPQGSLHTDTARLAAGVAEKMIRPKAVPPAQVPARLRRPGQLLEGWQWQDANGENLLLVFRSVSGSGEPQPAALPASNEVQDIEDVGRTAQLMVRQYVRQQKGSGYAELWRLQDAVQACALDMTLSLAPGSTTITDLDGDGRSETTLIYALACRGDVSSASLKLIMREGARKYALRGSTVVQYDSVPAQQRQPQEPCCADKLSKAQHDAGQTGGYYDNEADFRDAPPAFLVFARQQWQKFSVEKEQDHEDL